MNSAKEITIVTFKIYLECAKKSAQQLQKNWIIFIGSLLAYIAITVISVLLSNMNRTIAGFILGLASVALLSLFYTWIFNLAQGQKLKFKDLYAFDGELFNALLSTGFILWIANDFLLDPIFRSIQNPLLQPAVQMLLVIIFNPLAETVAYRRYSSISAFQHSSSFIKSNWIEWFCPFILLMSPIMIIINPLLILFSLSSTTLLFPTLSLIRIWSSFISLLIPSSSLVFYISPACALIIAIFYALFRAHLFIELENGTRRQRMFRARM